MKKAAIATLGCKVNQVESSSIVQQLNKLNFEIVGFDQQADIYIINTCTVTNRTDFKSRNLIRHALKHKADNPMVKVIVTGCYAQKEKDEINAIGEIDLIVDNQNKIDLDSWLDNSAYRFMDILKAEKLLWKPVNDMHERTRAFLKIQDGCDYYCSYCAVPYGRGKPRSLDYDEVIDQANVLVENGYKEIVLTGINLGLYQDIQKRKVLSDVIKALNEIDKLKLLRISSIEPDLWTDELLQIIDSSELVCPHFHIPLQSGSDDILLSMGRKYSADSVSDIVKKLICYKPLCAIGLDVICGFPGETDTEFAQTYKFIAGLPIAYLHVFGYSKRKNTTAASMKNQVNGSILKQRVSALTELSRKKSEHYKQMLISKKAILSGVLEGFEKNIGTALSDHYIRLYTDSVISKENQVSRGKAMSVYNEGILIQSEGSVLK